MKIEATELMIGDLVMYNPNVFIDDEYEPTHECYVYSIRSGEDIDFSIEGCYYPIPLTAEILEKNGFEGSPTKDMYLHIELWEQCQLKVELCQSEGLFVFVYTDKAPIDMYVNHILLHIRYVHELQHALRLCGFDELADSIII